MTHETDTRALVLAATGGDLDAFAELVRRFEGAAFAYARVRRAPSPDDAVQDAFVDAFLRLGQLREPAAFGGWLRRIVHKHVDRQQRARRPDALPEEAVSEADGPDRQLEALERRAALRARIDELPEGQRVVVALHYLGEQSVKSIGAFLGLAESAVKKRLFDARRRLRVPEDDAMMNPTSETHFADSVTLFLSIRAGAHDAVRAILDRRPDLLESREGWSDAEALAGRFELAHRLTPLILAAGIGDEEMVELLLARGAAPDSLCGCDAGETALWAATRAGHAPIAARLLEAGANAEATNAKGLRPRDLAAWRGTPELLALFDDDRPAAPAPAPRSPDDTVETGIRALDLWTPLPRGAVVRVHGGAETGLMVLLAELTHQVGLTGGVAVWTSWVPRPWHRRELATVASRYGVEHHVRFATPQPGDDLDAVLRRGVARCREESAGGRPVFHIVFEQEGHQAEVEAALPRLGEAATVTFVVRPWAAVTRGDVGAPTPNGLHDAVLVTDPRLAGQWLFPAIDPALSRSRTPHVDAEEQRLMEDARALLAAYAAIDPELARDVDEGDDAGTRRTIGRARRLLAVLTQPFHVATPETGWPGVTVTRAETFAEVRAVLAGAWDERAVAELKYRGAER